MKRNYLILCLSPDECNLLGILIADYISINNRLIDIFDDENKAYTIHKQNDILESLLKRFE